MQRISATWQARRSARVLDARSRGLATNRSDPGSVPTASPSRRPAQEGLAVHDLAFVDDQLQGARVADVPQPVGSQDQEVGALAGI